MDLQRQEYPSMLTHLQPPHAVRILNERIHHIRSTNSDVADWLQERRRIEDVYAQSLRKLASRPLGEENLDLGIFNSPWQKVVSSTKTLAQSHQTFAHNIEVDVERPLREFSTSNRELQDLSSKVVSNLQQTVKEIENASKRAEKLLAMGSKAAVDKVASAASSVEDARGQWDSEAPLVFEKLQEVDEMRWDQLRNSLTQLETYASDMSNSNSAAIQECLNVLLEVQTADEIQHFSMKAPGSVPQAPPSRHSERRMSMAAQPSLSASTSLAPPVPPLKEDAGSQRSNSIQEKPKSKLGGLRRLGTVLKGRRHSTHPYGEPLQSPDKTYEKKRSSTNITPKLFSRKSKERAADTLSPQVTGNLQASESHQSVTEPSITPRESDAGPVASIERTKSHISERELPEITEDSGLVNGNHTSIETPKPEETSQAGPSFLLPEQNFSTGASVAAPTPFPEPKLQETAAPLQGSDAITQALQEAALVNDSSNNQFKVDIRNAPIQEEDSDASAALANVANALRAQATPRRNNTIRGRRDRNTILLPSPSVPELPVAAAASTSSSSLPNSPGFPQAQQQSTPSNQITPFKLVHRSTLGTDDGNISDTHSIRSGRSLSSSISTTVRHPDLHEPGLSASIVETVSAWFSDGTVDRAVQIGEIALAYNPTDSNESPSTETIRFNHFSSLEKVAPNPHFIDQIPNKEGSYSVSLSKINKTAVAFKYQVLLDSAQAESYAPLRLVPAWKLEPTQTLFMLNYSFNPSFASRLPDGISSITLSNVIIIVHIDLSASSAKIVRCQASHGGVYARERHVVYWRLNDVTLSRDAPVQVLRAKLVTEGEPQPGNVEARWELGGDQLASVASGISLSRMEGGEPQDGSGEENDPFADESATPTPTVTWTDVKAVRKLRSGTYVAFNGGDG